MIYRTAPFVSTLNAAVRGVPVRILPVGSSVVQSCETVSDLGVWFDSELSMKTHISKVVSICYYHLRRLR